MSELKKADSLTQLGYSPRFLRTLETELNRSNLRFYAGEFDNKQPTSQHFMPHLPPLNKSEKQENGLQTREKFIKASRALLLKPPLLNADRNIYIESYIKSIGGEDHYNLPSIAAELAQGNNIMLRVIYGASTEMPLRGLSYIIPPMVFMENVTDQVGITPKMEVIFANHIGSVANDLDYESIRTESFFTRNFLDMYVNYFFPGLVDSVVYLEDKPEISFCRLVNSMALVAFISEDKQMKELASNKRTSNSPIKNLIYSAAHVVFHDMFSYAYLQTMSDRGYTPPDGSRTLISFGGQQEKFFYDLRNKFKQHLNLHQLLTLQYFTAHATPPYILDNKGDIGLKEFLQNPPAIEKEVGPAAKHDLNYLFNFQRNGQTFKSFMSQFL